MTFGDRWLAGIGPSLADLAGSLLAPLLQAVGEPTDDVDSLVRDSDAGPGWTQALDLTRTRAPGWLGQFVGVIPDAGITDDIARARVGARAGWRRGTPEVILNTGHEHLTPGATGVLLERDGGDPYALRLQIQRAQVVDSTAFMAAVQRAVPIGINLTIDILDFATWATVDTRYPTWASRNGLTWATEQKA